MRRYESELSPALLKLTEHEGYHPSVIVPSAEGVPVAGGDRDPDDWLESTEPLFEFSEDIASGRVTPRR